MDAQRFQVWGQKPDWNWKYQLRHRMRQVSRWHSLEHCFRASVPAPPHLSSANGEAWLRVRGGREPPPLWEAAVIAARCVLNLVPVSIAVGPTCDPREATLDRRVVQWLTVGYGAGCRVQILAAPRGAVRCWAVS